ncbi:cobaltochelatase CobN subunit [Tepidamorphus gemmatus]|uniref:Cobaltochelatase CobN subunit n=1 Tax=Tepidamorphus gemmatus TaxID=747076 RepID=A0A4R3MHQ8_9HYPH|nr:cobaltochelatase subunit CobN [Tepidamorphus gemmatus]TCT13575.1 cobaltochelatase CobN subunit [Tepidamorphus gemmatus]
MHILVRETRSLDDVETAVDLGQSPAPLVFLSFSDSDLGSAATAWQAAGDLPQLRLANIGRLRHPMSVDLYVEQVVAAARCVAVRLLGGLDYWRYGCEEIARTCRDRGIPVVFMPGDGREDARLRDLSTVDPAIRSRLDTLLAEGGPANMRAALRLLSHLAGLGDDDGVRAQPVALHGEYVPRTLSPRAGKDATRPLAVIVFYRAWLLAGDLAPVDALAAELDRRGLDVRALHVTSLKGPETARWVADTLRDLRPAVVLNATGFSARLDDGPSPLEAAGAPVLQVVLATSSREAWEASPRGLGQADLAMQVVLPELDGRLLATAVSFKADEIEVPGLEYARTVHRPDPAGIALAAARAAGWARLAATPRRDRRLALILSDYPGAAGQAAHAVGLDAIESAAEIVRLLGKEGYDTGPVAPTGREIVAALCDAEPAPFLSLDAYRRLFDTLPEATRTQILAAWGEPREDPAVVPAPVREASSWPERESRTGIGDVLTGAATQIPDQPAAARDEAAVAGKLGAGRVFAHRVVRCGNIILAIQPDRGNALDRKADYHDPDLPPRHVFVAFYLWLREVAGIDAMIHLGTHGTLEWLPGKAVALSKSCATAALIGGLPVIYPFIVNNPGEAAAAKRRLGAVTIGHLTPPLKAAGSHGAAAELERLIDEYAAADGLDRRRTQILRRTILDRAEDAGLLAESGASAATSDDDRLARLDAYLCDVKDLQIRDGLHVFGRAPDRHCRAALHQALTAASPGIAHAELAGRLDASADAERAALLAALDGRFVAPGPAGAPTRGRADVLPTGRNLYTVDPRAVPTRSAMMLAEKAAEDLVRRHMQDHGDWPRSLVIDLWGSATMRTGGEDLALALVLMGARPIWDEGSNRVSGFEILPLALLDRPRVDVTLRISGLFRDAFETQIALFDAVVRAIAERSDEAEWNPLAASARGTSGAAFRRATTRIFGAAPGGYGAGVTHLVEAGAWDSRDDLGRAYLAASAHAYGQGLDGTRDDEGFAERVRVADAFVHQQDHAEIDLLDTVDFAAHEGGFAAAAGSLGNAPALYHADTSRPEAPRTRTVAEEVRRVVRGRAANPAWIAGMMRHGYRGAAEIARGLEGLYGFAATLPERLDRQFDLLFDATLGDETVDRFLSDANPAARSAMADRFDEAIRRGLWRPRRNTVAAILDRRAS